MSNVLNCDIGVKGNPNKCYHAVGADQVDGCAANYFHISSESISSINNIGEETTTNRDYCLPIPKEMYCDKATLDNGKIKCERCTDTF